MMGSVMTTRVVAFTVSVVMRNWATAWVACICMGPITPELEGICIKAARAVGGGVLAVDIIEHPEKGFLVNEINHTLEFHTAQPTSGVDIAGVIVDYVIDIAKSK